MERLHLIIHGEVQGVGFRYATLHQARALDLSGWVANRYDGTVEICCEGSREKLERMALWAQVGPISATVKKVERDWSTLEKPSSKTFRIRF